MNTISILEKTFKWNTLANTRILHTLQKTGAEPGAISLISHALMAEYNWYLRIEGFDTGSRDTWSTLSIAECLERCQENDIIINSYLGSASGDDLTKPVTYKNSRNETFTNTVIDILTHVTFHSAHHRAQVNLRLREAGAQPVAVDFISFSRGKWEEESV